MGAVDGMTLDKEERLTQRLAVTRLRHDVTWDELRAMAREIYGHARDLGNLKRWGYIDRKDDLVLLTDKGIRAAARTFEKAHNARPGRGRSPLGPLPARASRRPRVQRRDAGLGPTP